MNQGHSGSLSLEVASEWMSNWNKRIVPRRFTLMGGEPTLHKDLVNFVYVAREKWPNSHVEVITNGFFLHKHPNLPKALKETNTILALSIHSNHQEYAEKFEPIYNFAQSLKSNGVQVEYRPSAINWIRQYKGFGDSMMPYEDNNPKQSWKYCVSKLCVQMHEGKLWKCPALAYLPMQANKYNLSDKWTPYLKYVPLSHDCSREELRDFFTRKEESFCSMCPAEEHYFAPENPLLPVSYWKKKYADGIS